MSNNTIFSLKSSCNKSITKLWKSANYETKIQYNLCKNTKQFLKYTCNKQTSKLQSHLSSQGLIDQSLQKLNSLWSKAKSKLLANIFTFSIKYLNNTLATRRDFHLWNLSATSDCIFCHQLESLIYIIAGCKMYPTEGCYTL